jgi:hypothetical protein
MGARAMNDMVEVDDQGVEILYMRLSVAAEPNACMGENVALVYTKVLEKISEMTPGPRRNACVRDFASRIAQITLCEYHWTAIDRLLHQLINVWKQPVQ